MSEKVPRVVLDCMIFLQGAGRRGGPARKCLELIAAGHLELCLSPAILSEIDDVLNRPLVRAKFPLLSNQSLLLAVRARGHLFSHVPSAFPLPRDPRDEPYTDLAVAADARYLVTWNERHLTYLMKRDTPEGRGFRQRFPGLTILDPPSLLAALRDTP